MLEKKEIMPHDDGLMFKFKKNIYKTLSTPLLEQRRIVMRAVSETRSRTKGA